MEKQIWKFRGNLSKESYTKVKKIQGEEMAKNNIMTQAETMEFIIKNFKGKVKK